MNFLKTFIIIAVSILLFSCGDFSTPAEPSTPVQATNISGDWIGTMSIPSLGQSGYLNFTINQSGNNLSGTFTTSTNRYGKISGTLSGSNLSGTLTFQDSCGGSSSVSGTLSSDKRSIAGNGSVSDCIGKYSFSFSITKQ